MNNSTSLVIELFQPSIQYICFGLVAVFANLVIFFTLFRNIKYLKKSALITGLALGDLLNGLSLVGAGAMRLALFMNDMSALTVHPTYCMKIFLTPVVLMGHQIPGVMFLLVGTERFTAVYFYNWYHSKWSNKLGWTLTSCVYMLCIFSVLSGFGVTLSYEADYRTSINCLTPLVIGPTYSTFNYSIDIVGGVIAATATIIAMVTFTKRKSRVVCATHIPPAVKFHLKKQQQLSLIAFCLTVVDFTFLVVPSVMVTLVSGCFVNFNIRLETLYSVTIQLVCCRSILNVVIYILINQGFRRAIKHAFCFTKNSGQSISLNENKRVAKTRSGNEHLF